ncbi:MAG: oligoendopeptidase F [Oscillospiraceae bacterium]|nr:oligoendopeptidase F [Oscillospiraceae bacterium]
MEKKTFQSRNDIPLKDRWATEDLYSSDELWEQELAHMVAQGKEMASYAGKLGQDAKTLLSYMKLLEDIQVRSAQLSNYAQRKGDEDTRVAAYQAMGSKFSAAFVELNASTSFETPELMAIPEETLERYYAEEPELERFRRFIGDQRRLKDHVLSPAEEKLLASAGNVTRLASDAYGMLQNADMTYPDAIDSEGNAHKLTGGTFVPLEMSPDRALRRDAHEKLYGTLAAYKNTSAALLFGQVKQLKFMADARHYGSALEASLSRTNVPTSVYHNLIEAVHQNMDKMHRYVRLRKKLLGVDELHFYDVYTNLVNGVDRYISIEEAKQTVYAAMAPLGEEYQAILKHGFENRWIDVYENPGKRGGAYSSGARVHPYVLLNHSGTLKSQFTLAHEMGHALHSYFSNRTQKPLDSHYVIFVAEVASTCNEALLMEYLLNKTTDKRERAFLINHFLEQFKGTLYRQTMFAEFELKMGELVQSGVPLTAAKLCEEYRKLNELYFGPDMVVDDEISMEWARIPHFYYNYYVFQYATGYSAAIALSQKILKEGKPAVEKYLEFLSGGRSKPPVELLKGAGVDMSSPEPVNQALELFGKLLDEMEQLAEEL